VYSALYGGGFNLEALSLDGSNASSELATSAGFPRFSPDGRLIAYTSGAFVAGQVYVRRFPDAGRVLVANAGSRPIWDPDSRRIYFKEGGRVHVATLDRGADLRVVSRTPLFETRILGDFDLARDGRFLMIEPQSSSASLVVIPNWKTELGRLTSAAGR
jgi:hypothetical protein